tara:strand:- start:1638 stop:1868 length:231 start_codon:yes stop_codon:yes gene_type:complete
MKMIGSKFNVFESKDFENLKLCAARYIYRADLTAEIVDADKYGARFTWSDWFEKKYKENITVYVDRKTKEKAEAAK